MRKFENVDIIDTLYAAMKQNTQHYQTDFEYDKESFTLAATSTDANGKNLLWMSRESGTWCLNERSAFILEAEAHIIWTNYAETQDSIVAFAVEISAIVNGKPIGTLYELDYKLHVENIRKVALHVQAVTLTFADGNVKLFQYEDYSVNWNKILKNHGDVVNYRFEVRDESALQSLLQQEHKARSKFPSRSVSAFVKELQPKKVSVTERLNQANQAIKPVSAKKSATNDVER